MADPIRDALERAARELELVAGSLTQAGWAAAGSRARNEAHAARAALAAQPPAPAVDTPLDLDALLSPEGAYEPGTGHEDGAQLVDQLEWWAPLHGCDTLDNLLDRIRERILPHLRPPIAGIDVPGGDGDYGDVLDLCEAEGVDPRIGAPLLKRAREAWKVSAQPPEQVLTFLDAIRLANGCHDYSSGGHVGESIEAFHAGIGTVVEVLKKAAAGPWDHQTSAVFAAGSEPIAQSPAPAPAPVPVAVAERLPGPKDCDAEGRVWWLLPSQSWPCLYLGKADSALAAAVATHWAPHWAIPLPQPPQGGEVE
jgi:hypothetical protein